MTGNVDNAKVLAALLIMAGGSVVLLQGGAELPESGAYMQGGRDILNNSWVYQSIPHEFAPGNRIIGDFFSKEYSGGAWLAIGYNSKQIDFRLRYPEYESPHTIYYNRTWTYKVLNVTSIQQTGDPCEIGFEYNRIKRKVNYQYEEGDFASNVFCFDEYADLGGNDYQINVSVRLNKTENWKKLPLDVRKINFTFDGLDTWYVINPTVQEDVLYRWRALYDTENMMYSGRAKIGYASWRDLTGKPLQDAATAISEGKFNYIDPYMNGWTNAVNLTIYNQYDTALTDYEVCFDFNISVYNVSGLMHGLGKDLNVLNSTNQSLYFWTTNSTKFMNGTANTTFCFLDNKLDAGNNTRYLILNNSNAEYSLFFDGWDTFDYAFDDFYGSSLDTNNWTSPAGTYAVADHILSVRGDAARTQGYHISHISPPYVLTYYVSTNGGNMGSNYVYSKNPANTDAAYFVFEAEADDITHVSKNDDVATTTKDLPINSNTNWNKYEIYVNSTHTQAYQNGVLLNTHTTNIPNDAVGLHFYSGTDTSRYMYWDYTFIRKWTAKEPIVYIGEPYQISQTTTTTTTTTTTIGIVNIEYRVSGALADKNCIAVEGGAFCFNDTNHWNQQ